MRVIFLDCDGVLNCTYTNTYIPDTRFIGLEDELLQNLKTLLDKSNEEEETKIVLSSSWRNNYVKSGDSYEESGDNVLPYLKENLARFGMEIYDYTPYLKNENGFKIGRGHEILEWLKDKRDIVTNYVVLDDDRHIGFELEPGLHWIHTSFYQHGFTENYIEPALEILRGNLPAELEEEEDIWPF